MNDIIEIVKSLETIQTEAKEQSGAFLGILLGALGASLLGDILTGRGTNRARERVIRAGYGNKRGQKATPKR